MAERRLPAGPERPALAGFDSRGPHHRDVDAQDDAVLALQLHRVATSLDRVLELHTKTRMARSAGADKTGRGASCGRSASVHDPSSVFQGSAGAAAVRDGEKHGRGSIAMNGK